MKEGMSSASRIVLLCEGSLEALAPGAVEGVEELRADENVVTDGEVAGEEGVPPAALVELSSSPLETSTQLNGSTYDATHTSCI